MTRRRAGWRSPNIKLGSVQTAYMKKLMNSKVHSLVDKTNVHILQMFQGLGMNYILQKNKKNIILHLSHCNKHLMII